MLALTLGQAKNLALAVAVVFVVGAVASAWVMKTITQKVALILIFGLLAVVVWTQRASLDECADKVRAGGLQGANTTCSFFGRDVQIDTTRS